MLEYKTRSKLMVVAEYKIMLQEHKKLIKKLNEAQLINADDILVDWSDLVSASEDIVKFFEFTAEDYAHRVSDLYDEIDELKGHVEFYQDILTKTNKALCDMIDIVKEKQYRENHYDGLVQAEWPAQCQTIMVRIGSVRILPIREAHTIR